MEIFARSNTPEIFTPGDPSPFLTFGRLTSRVCIFFTPLI